MFDRATDDLRTDLLVALELQRVDDLGAAQERHAAAGDDAFLDGRTGRVQRVFHAGLLLLHLGLGRGADIDDRHATGELRQAFLQLLAVVVGGRLVDLPPDLLHAALDVGALAATFDDRRVFLVDRDPLGAAEVAHRDVLELDPEILGDALAAGEDRDVLEHRLAAIAEARRLDRTHVERAADLVHDERGQRLALDFLGDDEKRLAALRHRLEQREEVLQAS